MHEDKDKYKMIKDKLKEQDRSFNWFAKKVGCNESNLRKTLKNSVFLYPDLIVRMSDVIGEDLSPLLFPKFKRK